MPEAKTEIVPLNISALPWDSKYNINPIVINMVTDTNNRLLSIPVNQTLYVFFDFSISPPSDNVTILAIMRAHKSQGVYNDLFRVNQFVSDYAIITTQFLPTVWTPDMGLATITILRIDELTHEVLAAYQLTNIDVSDTPLLNPNFMNRGDFSFGQNSSDQCAFIDDNELLWYFEVSSSVTTNAQRVTYNGARFEYIGAGSPEKWGVLGSVGSDEYAAGIEGITITDITAQIQYRTFFDITDNGKQLIVVLQDYGIIYNAEQNLFYFTEIGDFSKILFEWDNWPKYNGRSDMPYDPANWTLNSGGTPPVVGQLGTPVTVPAPGRIVDMVGINSSLYIYTQDGIYRYNLIQVNNNPTLQPDTTFNMNYKIRLNSNAIVYQNAMYFDTEDDKRYVLNTKGLITELTNRLLPDKYNFTFNQFYANDNPINYYPARILIPIKIFNMNCILDNYTLYNIDTGNFSFLIANSNLQFTWQPTDITTCTYDQPKRITASSDNGKYIGLQNIFQYVPTDFDNSISNLGFNLDYFSDGLIITSPYDFEGKNKGTLAGLNISFVDSNFDPALYQTFDAITLGIYFIIDNAFDANLMNNIRDDVWWQQYEQTFNRTYSTNIFSAKFNITCQTIRIVIRFSPFTVPTTITPQFELQKFATDNIMLNIIL